MDNPLQSLGGRTSSDAVVLKQMLAELEPGKVLTYEEMSAAVGHDVQADRSGLYKAQRQLLQDNNAVFTVVRGEGLKRAEGADALEELERVNGNIRRKARKTVQRAKCVDMTPLSHEQRLRATVLGTQLHETAKAHRKPSLDKVRARIVANGTQLGLPSNIED